MLPGYAVYDATKGAVEQFTHILASLEAMSAFGRLGQPAVAAFLASDAAGWVTAQNIRVNGGTA
jgi:3-oxoacyl-[acyl-carrier protein] reductase